MARGVRRRVYLYPRRSDGRCKKHHATRLTFAASTLYQLTELDGGRTGSQRRVRRARHVRASSPCFIETPSSSRCLYRKGKTMIHQSAISWLSKFGASALVVG